MKGLTLPEMERMSTKRLLAFKRKLPRPDEFEWECTEHEECIQRREFFVDQIGKLRKVLATREHVDRPGKSKK